MKPYPYTGLRACLKFFRYSLRTSLLAALIFGVNLSFASDSSDSSDSSEDTLKTIKSYLLNLGAYLGYSLQTDPTQSTATSETLLQITTQAIPSILFPSFQSLFGAIPVNTVGVSISATGSSPIFVENNVQDYAQLNSFANSTFTAAEFSSPSGLISISPLIDQPSTTSSTGSQQYQNDPVSQAVANILTTPADSYCMDNSGQNWVQCTYGTSLKNDNQIMQNVIGSLPDTQTYFTPNYNQTVIPQLNSNSLIAPLLYSNQATNTTAPSSVSTGAPTGSNPALQAQTPAQQAQNFIRYATSAVSPMTPPNRNTYDNLYVQSIPSGSSPSVQNWQAASTLSSYLTSVRVYAAQSSVAISNLYYMLSKRMPQPTQGQNGEAKTTSEALSEYTMATWRIFNPNQIQQGKTQWLSSLDQASAATISKEIAVLLAEINYQLYLNRQQEERMLLTNSIMLLTDLQKSQPDLSTTAQNAPTPPESAQ